MPELHVAQQSRREKLRSSSSASSAQQSEDFHQCNFYNQLNPVTLPSEMLNFTPNSGSFSSIHPTRFISASGDPQNGCDFKPFSENWVLGGATFGGSESDYQNNLQNWENWHSSFVGDRNLHHGLSLSLSSNQICEIRRLGLKPLESESISSIVNQSVTGEGNLTQDIVGGSMRNLGPLGPFTGYATILKSSKFLKPAQQLLDEFLNAAGLKTMKRSEESESGSLAPSNGVIDCGGSKSCGSNDFNGGSGHGDQSCRPDCHEKKVKLLSMQEEVCERQKQYNQEIQMVISAFESVPGLANATPYILRSLKTISRHFRCLKNAIADQLKYIKCVLGEDLSSPPTFPRSDCTSLRFSQNFAKVKSGSFGGMGYQNHVWRPQRGLPERAVSILRAWLFDHFLHPYPTDTDKQMLASQTGLSRNQVSNWFINARVRLWKPMVEEIHMLETKGVPDTEINSSNSKMSPIVNNRQQDSGNQPGFQSKQFECSGSSSSMQGTSSAEMTAPHLLQKHPRTETHRQQIPTTSMDDGSFVGFLPFQRRGLEIGANAAVSLTLGLRHGSETTQQLQHQFQPQEMHFAGHIPDFSA